MQSGAHAAHAIERRLRGDTTVKPFHYRDLGTLAVISRFTAVAKIGPLQIGGFPGWLVWLVVHVNHAREISEAARAALRRVQRRGIPVLGQSVLLREVNDTEAALEALLRAMVAARVKPYYLHQLDPAPGTARFHVPIAEGQALLRALHPEPRHQNILD